jgi:hypothetical protein
MSIQETKKLSIEETMKEIELEAEMKLIQEYKTGKIQMPTFKANGATLVVEPIKNTDKQIDILKDIMANGAKKFEAKTGRRMTYS